MAPKRGKLMVDIANGINPITPLPEKKHKSMKRPSNPKNLKNIGYEDDFDSILCHNLAIPVLPDPSCTWELDKLPNENPASKCHRFLKSNEQNFHQMQNMEVDLNEMKNTDPNYENKSVSSDSRKSNTQTENVDPDYEIESESSNSTFNDGEIDNIIEELNENMIDEFAKDSDPKKKTAKNKTDDLSKDTNVKYTNRSKKIWDKKDLCPFCFEEVTHFSRHLLRKHSDEKDMQHILKLEKNNPERRKIFDALRKRGNFTLMTKKKVICPVRRPENTCNASPTEYVPCQFCLGIYKKTSLFRHSKLCKSSPKNYEKKGKLNPVGESQTLLALHYGSHGSFMGNSRLKNEVFPIMAADDISLTAKSDPLICIYGECYIGKHRRVQMRNKVSNEIREFARLLISLKKCTKITTMMDTLNPALFSDVVEAVKIISGYDTQKKTFNAPSLALHMRTNLDHLCATAEKVILQKHPLFLFKEPEVKLKEIKQFRKLVRDHFSEEISSLALKDLNTKKWQKTTSLPKTSNIEIFNNFLKSEAEEAFSKLGTEEENEYYYTKLVKCTFALTVLINRKRIGEVQFLTRETYNRDYSGINLEEFHKKLSQFEIELASKFKRVVTSGKGSKPVPIIFPKKLETYITKISEIRDFGQFVNKTNPYLFALPKTDRWVSGYHVIKGLAHKSKIENPNLMTSTRFRKHLATIMQLLNYDKCEMEQVARFMGHTAKTHEEYYRLPDNIYQTAKMAKVLMLNSEDLNKFRGISMDKIEFNSDLLDDETNLDSNDDPSSDELDPNKNTDVCTEEQNNADPQIIVTSKGIRKRWLEGQKKKMKTHFRTNIINKKAPNRKVCEEFLHKFGEMFEGRKWVDVKTFIYNCYK